MKRFPRSRSRKPMSLLVAGMLAAGLPGCDTLDDLLEVDPQDRVPSSALADPAQAPLLADGVAASFECAFGAYVTIFGLIGDELRNAQGNVAFQAYDKRDQSPSGGPSGIYSIGDCYLGGGVSVERFGIYKPVSTARWFADDLLRQLDGWTDQEVANRTALIARTATYAGFSHILLGEGFCSAAIDGGSELTPRQIFERAEQKFLVAIQAAQGAGDEQILNTARVGLARALLDQGDPAGAASVAEQVAPGFAAYISASATSHLRFNRIFQFNNQDRLVTIEPLFRDLEFGGVADPRVPVLDLDRLGSDNRTPLWVQQKYGSLDSGIPLATWEEAQLIIAEAVGGQRAVGIINQLHAAAGLPAFQSTDEAEIRSHVIEERRRQLFLDSHRIYDIIRLGLPLEPPAGAPFPGNAGGVYGSTTCLPLPDVEKDANPNIP